MKSGGTTLSRRATIMVVAFFGTSSIATGQALTPQHTSEIPQSPSAARSEILRFPRSFSLLSPLTSQLLEDPYRPITPSQRLRWFVTSTIGPAHLAGVGFVSACGTSVNRPPEYGPHWVGFANRFGMGMAGSATSNTMEAGVGLILREDPRYFRVPRQGFKSRVANVATLTFLARNESARSEPAYARYLGIVGGNFLSNTWRVHSEANAPAALVRAAEGFAGRMAANAFEEFWPDVKGYVFRKHKGLADGSRHD